MNKRRRYKAKKRRIINYWSRVFDLPWKYKQLGRLKPHGEISIGLIRSIASRRLLEQGIHVDMYRNH